MCFLPYVIFVHLHKLFQEMNMLSIFLGWVGGYEWILIILVVVLLFGGRKIPELMKGVGRGIREFKEGVKEPDTNPTDNTKD